MKYEQTSENDVRIEFDSWEIGEMIAKRYPNVDLSKVEFIFDTSNDYRTVYPTGIRVIGRIKKPEMYGAQPDA